MNSEPKPGSRKVVLTKWMLIIFAVGTGVYMIVCGYRNWPVAESFYMNFVIGIGAIGGAFTVGNIFEHKSLAKIEEGKSQIETAKENAKAEKEKKEKAQAEIEAEKLRVGSGKVQPKA